MLNFRLPKKLLTLSQQKAQAEGRSLSEICRGLMERWIQGNFRFASGRPTLPVFRERLELTQVTLVVPEDLKRKFQDKVRIKDWETSTLLVRLLQYWTDGFASPDDGQRTYTLHEAAAALGVSMPTIRRRLQRDKQRGSSLAITAAELDTLRRQLEK